MRRGEFRWFRFDAPDKRRPVLLLGPLNDLDAFSQIPVVPLTTQPRDLPWEVALGPEDGLPSRSFLKPEWIRSVEKALLGPFIAELPRERWAEVCRAVNLALGLSTMGDGTGR